LSLNAPVKSHGSDSADDGNDTPATWQDFLFDNQSIHDRELPSFDCLNERERAILAARYADGLTLKELAARYTISVERVRQIEAKALAKLRAAP
jgi:RNA polymerase sigma-32 factor